MQIVNQNIVSCTVTVYTANIRGKPDSCPDWNKWVKEPHIVLSHESRVIHFGVFAV